jgi:Mg2+-importing ATPase
LGVLLPFSALARPLGFVPLTATFYAFVTGATLIYLASVQLAKRWLVRYVDNPAPKGSQA